jgi:hypothetical protein
LDARGEVVLREKVARSDLRTRLQPAAVAALFIGVSPSNQDTASAAAAAFNLTPAETRVLVNLLGGVPW